MDFLSTEVLEAIRVAYEQECLKKQIKLLEMVKENADVEILLRNIKQQLNQLKK